MRIIGTSFNAEAFQFTESVGLRPKSKQSWIAGSVAVPTAPKQVFHTCKRKKWLTLITQYAIFINILEMGMVAAKPVALIIGALTTDRKNLNLVRKVVVMRQIFLLSFLKNSINSRQASQWHLFCSDLTNKNLYIGTVLTCLVIGVG